MYVWIFAYLADASDGMFILLKKSLKCVQPRLSSSSRRALTP